MAECTEYTNQKERIRDEAPGRGETGEDNSDTAGDQGGDERSS